jgi:hypothetical protein
VKERSDRTPNRILITTMSDVATTAPAALGGAMAAEGSRPVAAWIPLVCAGVIDAAALAILLGRPGASAPLVAAVLHVVALLPFAVRSPLTASERGLGAAFVFGLPVVGAPLAALAVMTVGQGELLAAPADEPVLGGQPRAEELRRLGEALPCCEALLAGQAEERRAIIATLTRRADGDAVALLRWALGAPDPELAVEAALALEEIAASFEADLAGCRKRVAEAGGAAADEALAAAELITDAIDSGIADPALIGPLAHEARGYFEQASNGSSARVLAIASGRVQLELAVLRPDTALACIDEALGRVAPEDRPTLQAMREEAVLASHALPWEGPSALATYVHAPAITARRRYGSVARGTNRVTGAARGTNRALPRGTGSGIAVGPVQIPGPASRQPQPQAPPESPAEEGDQDGR